MMFVYNKLIALSFLLGVCFSFELPKFGHEVQDSRDSELEKLLSSIRQLVTGLKNSIKIQTTKISSLEGNYQSLSKKVESLQGRFSNVERRLNSARTICHEKATAWAPYSNASIMFLDRQAVTCPKGFFLSRFHLVRQADRNNAPVHYLFRCCKFAL